LYGADQAYEKCGFETQGNEAESIHRHRLLQRKGMGIVRRLTFVGV
jgi:hypothetical protein